MQVTSHGAGPFDFLLQANTSTTDEVFTLTNNGNVNAIINTVTIVGAGPFTILAEDCTTNSPILPAATCDVTVRFAPVATANYTGDLFRVNYDDGTLVAPVNADYGVEGQSQTLQPYCQSLQCQMPFIYPDTVHTNTLDHTWQITNGGGVTATTVTIGGLAYPFSMPGGYPGGGTCPIAGTIGAGVSCTVIVRFAPTDTATGVNAYADTLELDYQNGVGAATQVTQAISGNGIDRAILAITPNPHDYSNVAVGGLSRHKHLQ